MGLIDALYAEWEAQLEDCVSNVDDRMRDVLQDRAPVASGATRRSITVRRTGKFEWTAKATTDQGYIQDKGTDGYTIKPRTKKALFWDGAAFPVKEVDHPGSRKHVGWWTDAEVSVGDLVDC